jgi:hypothetical protein
MLEIKREPIYRHQYLSQREIDSVKPLFESAFSGDFDSYKKSNNPLVQKIGQERLNFAASQYANRLRVSKSLNVSPLFEDANIFGNLGQGQLKKLFESVSTPSNIIGVGNVVNPDPSNIHNGGIWNPAYKTGSGDLPSYIFGLQSQLALHCIGFDLIPVVSVDTPKIVLTYIDTVYGGGKFDNLENLPSYIEISSPLFKRSFVEDKALVRGSTKLYLTDPASKKSLELRFIVASTIKAALTVEVLSTGEHDTTAGTYTKTNAITVKDVVDVLNSLSTGEVYVIQENAVVADYQTAGNDGVITANSLGLNYASATRTNISEATTNNNSQKAMSREQHEKGPKHKLNVISLEKQLEIEGIEIEADTNNIQIKDFAAMGVNVIAYLYTGVQNALVQTIDEHILNHLYALGVTHALGVYNSQGTNYSLYIGNTGVASISYATEKRLTSTPLVDMLDNNVGADFGVLTNSLTQTAYENQITHADRLYSRILLTSEFGSYQNRIAPYDIIVASGTLCATLKKHSTFSITPVASTLSSAPELFYTGTIFDSIAVYKNGKIPFNDPRILFIRRGDDTDPGAKLIAYDLAASRQTLAEDTMAEKIRVWSRFAIADIGFYPELNYYTAVFINDFDWA